MHNQAGLLGPRPTNGWAPIYDLSFLEHESDIFCQMIEHAGYRRNILRRNPKRYDANGEELEDDDEDEEADAQAAEENPYAGIQLESKAVWVMAERVY